MPLYEYACCACATVFNKLRPLSAAGETMVCPHCGATATRTITAFAVHQRTERPQPTPRPAAPEPQLCRRYPHIPLVCHMEGSAAERWIAKAEGREEQYVEHTARQQEAAARAGLPPPPDPHADHAHHFGHGHVAGQRATNGTVHHGEAR
jgi:putative FmdB family regulatory protein